MKIGTRQKLSRFEECALSLYLDGRQLEQTQEERLLGLDIDPSLSWSSHVANFRKKLLKRVAVRARINKILPVTILVNTSIKPVLEEICPEMHALAKMAEMAINRQNRQTINKNSNEMAKGPFAKWRFQRKWQKWRLIAKIAKL